MKETFRKFISQYVWDVVLVVLLLVVTVKNFSLNHWITGWDNLHPEFNIAMNLGRSVSSVWQEYQGLGLLGGMAHGADLIRQLIILPLSLFVPQQGIRQILIITMLFLGVLGTRRVVQELLKSKEHDYSFAIQIASTLAGAFYLLNLGTIQNFYVPFEPFYWYYGFLPWLLYYLIKFLNTPNRKYLFVFAVISLLATPLAYLQTAFVTYAMCIGIFLLGYILIKPSKTKLFNALKLLIVTLAINSFWLLPVIYFTITKVDVTIGAKMNQIATPEVALSNAAYSNLPDIALVKGYWMSLHDSIEGSDFVYLFAPWRDYFSDPLITFIGFGLFGLVLFGLTYTLISKKFNYKFGLLGWFLLCTSMLLIANSSIPFFSQIFRSPFTKWVVPLTFIYSLFFGIAIYAICKLLNRVKVLGLVIFILMLAGLSLYVQPIFNGELIYSRLEVKIPGEYFKLFDYFKTKPKQSRIAFMPVQTLWGWNFYDWGYRGSGFLWYGIEQPILDRAFDVWSSENETFFQEFSTAIYSQNVNDIQAVLKKYDVNYIVLDKNVVAPKGLEQTLLHDNINKQLFELGGRIDFDQDGIVVYDLSALNGSQEFIKTPDSTTLARGETQFVRRDPIFAQNGLYTTTQDSVYYPFSDLSAEEIKDISYEGNQLALHQELSNVGSQLTIPEFPNNKSIDLPITVTYQGREVSIQLNNPYNIFIDGSQLETPSMPTLYMTTDRVYDSVIVNIEDANFEVMQSQNISDIISFTPSKPLTVNIYDATQSEKVDLDEQFSTQIVNTCWEREGQSPVVQSAIKDGVLSITTKDAVGCVAYKLGAFGFDVAKSIVKVTLPYMSENGSRPDFCVVEEGSNQCLHDDIFYHSNSSDTWSEVSRNLTFNPGINYWIIISGRPSDTKDDTWTINYQVPQINYYNQISGYEFQTNNWKEFFDEHSIAVNNPKELKVEFAAKQNTVDFGKDGLSQAKNCDLFERGEVTKIVSSEGVEYGANNFATSCDYVTLRGVDTANEFVLRFEGETLSGRGPKFYLFNKATARNDMENILVDQKFDHSYSVIDWNNFDPDEYILNLETRSFDNAWTRNVMNNVSAYNLPTGWLSNWQFIPTEFTAFENNVNISNIQKFLTFFYSADISANGENNLIQLSQGSDTGWWANKGDKVLVNGWANGWIVPQGNYKMRIIYIPQVLQFVGFGLVIGCFILLTYPKKSPKI